MIKGIVLITGIVTLLLNMLLTYYIVREKRLLHLRSIQEPEVVSFDLATIKATIMDADQILAEDTEILTESKKLS